MSAPNMRQAAAAAMMGAVLTVGGIAAAQQAPAQQEPAPATQQFAQAAQVINASYRGQQVTLAFGERLGDLRRQATISNINCPVVVSPVQLPGSLIGVRVGDRRVMAADEVDAAHVANQMCEPSGRS